MLTKRIIPCLDVDRGRVVKGTNFVGLRDAGDPVEVARRYEEQGADELVFLDITASHEGRAILLDMVRRVAEADLHAVHRRRRHPHARRRHAAHPGRGGEGQPQLRRRQDAGTDRRRCRGKFGRCATVVNIDPKRVTRDGREVWEVHINGGRVPTGLEAVAWARRVEELGAGEIVLTSMDADGTKNGYDLPMPRGGQPRR